jgi:Putative transposase/Transposase zinc-binding domain
MSHELAAICEHYLDRYKQRFAASTTTNQWSALNAILGCRTEQYGEMALSCPGCSWQSSCHRSCGHRACNQCQHHSTKQWLERQEKKLLPVDYFMVTFTLPRQLRALAKVHQQTIYSLLFKCTVSTLKIFGLNEPKFASELAMTGVLHTHTRRLDYHPHVHMIVPAGGINSRRSEWRQIKGKYLFNGFKLAAAFRGCLLRAIDQAGLRSPSTPKKWVVQCKRVGQGLPALKYLSRYLYRGVISNKNIIADDGNYVTFRYRDSDSGKTKTRRLRGEAFMALVLQHTLPKRFRRARDFGFLHGNARRRLQIVQWVLKVIIQLPKKIDRPKFICKCCGVPMSIVGFIPPKPKSG